MTKPMRRLTAVYAMLLLGNIGAWLWALMVFGHNPVLIGTATLAYVLGLRHAVDADHIAAIDNVSRKLVQQGKESITIGLYFSLGHSTLVALACGIIAATSADLRNYFSAVRVVGELVSTGISASFLFIIALVNVIALTSVWRNFRASATRDVAVPFGPLSRILQPLMAVISKPSQMFPLGILFGLGFDTASELGLLSVSASQANHAASLGTIMVFPALFTAGMSLVDTTDGLLMGSAYGWALVEPHRKLAYNFAITLFSILVALIIGVLEALNLIANRFAFTGVFWHWISDLNSHYGAIGCAIIVIFMGCWALSLLLSRSTLAPSSQG